MGNRSKATLRYYFVCVCSIYVQPLREGFLLLYLPCVRYPSSTQRRKQNSKHYTEGLTGTSKPRQDKQNFLVRTHKPLQNATTPFGKKDNPLRRECVSKITAPCTFVLKQLGSLAFWPSQNMFTLQNFSQANRANPCAAKRKLVQDTKHQQTTAHHSNPFFSVMAIV